MRMKRCVKAVLTLLLALCFTLPAAAAAFPEPTSRFFVNDFADVMSAAAEDAVYAAGVQLYEKTGAQAVVVTIDSLDGRDIESYGLNLGREWGIGDAEANTGVLLLLAVEDREVRIEVGYGLEGAITDAQSGLLLDTYAIPHFSHDDFETGLQETYAAIVNEVYLEFGLEADPDYVPAEQLEDEMATPLWDVIYFVFLIILIVLGVLSRVRRGVFFVGHSRHHHHGGFHGGGGSFGGGGGFRGGGGSFGGGGSSRGF
ncbi:MAG: TPM domain-containing protein [Clostridia bacterium]|nr:TPM domain-containing protein [Clostridia bacterium]